MTHFALFCSPPPLSLHALQLTTPPCKGGGRVTSVMLPCCYLAVTMLLPCHGNLSFPWLVESWLYRRSSSSLTSDYFQICISLYQIRCSPVFRDFGYGRKERGLCFLTLGEHTGDTYSCIKDVQRCILHDRSPLSEEIRGWKDLWF